jgi:hypothetical protein
MHAIKGCRSRLIRAGVLAACLLITADICSAGPLDTKRFIGGAFLKYETVVTLPTTERRWNQTLDNLVLMGKLWEAYGFSPHYTIQQSGKAYHIIDPTGIDGILSTVEAGKNQRTFLAEGRMKNWCIPITITGRVLFLVRCKEEGEKVTVRLGVYGEGSNNRLEQAMLKAVAPLITFYIERRIKCNFSDFSAILSDMDHNPDLARGKLAPSYHTEYNLFIQ